MSDPIKPAARVLDKPRPATPTATQTKLQAKRGASESADAAALPLHKPIHQARREGETSDRDHGKQRQRPSQANLFTEDSPKPSSGKPAAATDKPVSTESVHTPTVPVQKKPSAE
ncbi:MAG TPA: hypothetical protein ENI75_03265 [Mizugakiibacter sp.]|nr:hypothetical protein [Mizugakiibacter sp.]